MVLERFAKKIRSLRERSGMTQESFANEINMDRS